MGYPHVNRQQKLEPLVLVAMGFKQHEASAATGQKPGSVSRWWSDAELRATAERMAPKAAQLARRKMAGRLGGLARWGKSPNGEPKPTLTEQAQVETGQRPKPEKKAKVKKPSTSKKVFKGAPKSSRVVTEEMKQKLRDHYANLPQEEKDRRIQAQLASRRAKAKK